MYLIVGLGNPSPKYDHTRHNVGREAVKWWAKELNLITGKKHEPAPELKIPNFSGHAYRADNSIVAPDLGTFMNESGPAVQTLLSFFKIPVENLVLVHDELAFPLGEVRIQKNISAAGHNGVQSIIDALGSQDFTRLRLGIESRPDHQVPSEDFVLQKISLPPDLAKVNQMLKDAAKGLTTLADFDLERAMNQINKH